MSGLNLPSLSALYKQLQVSRQCQLLMSADACVLHLAEKHPQKEGRLSWKSFKPVVIVCDTLADDPGRNRKALSLAAKRKVKDREARQRLSRVQQLPNQAEMIRAISSETAAVWVKAVQVHPYTCFFSFRELFGDFIILVSPLYMSNNAAVNNTIMN